MYDIQKTELFGDQTLIGLVIRCFHVKVRFCFESRGVAEHSHVVQCEL